ncbi:hypothetical protein [Streptomyces sp. NRRL F-5650]|uniref:hypothetical protein n=1 Tax=Streptomyces sp. NRRL F-5650 TaxID=1463868 RepID=UPI00131EA33B|nr:hypothetical protein [Streptomyces sp. NRRL F-5650]
MTENIPAAIGLPIALDLSGGLTPVLALAIPSTVQRSELDEFIARHGFVPRQQTAQAHASRTRWALEPDGRLTVTFNTEERRARFQMPNEPEIQAWAAFAIARGGTVGIMILPEMDAPTAAAVALRTRMGSGEYWLLSAGLDI